MEQGGRCQEVHTGTCIIFNGGRFGFLCKQGYVSVEAIIHQSHTGQALGKVTPSLLGPPTPLLPWVPGFC